MAASSLALYRVFICMNMKVDGIKLSIVEVCNFVAMFVIRVTSVAFFVIRVHVVPSLRFLSEKVSYVMIKIRSHIMRFWTNSRTKSVSESLPR